MQKYYPKNEGGDFCKNPSGLVLNNLFLSFTFVYEFNAKSFNHTPYAADFECTSLGVFNANAQCGRTLLYVSIACLTARSVCA